MAPCRISRCDMQYDPPLLLVQSIVHFRDRLDALKFGAIRLLGVHKLLTIPWWHARSPRTTVGEWTKRLWNFGGRSTWQLTWHFKNPESLYVRCYVEESMSVALETFWWKFAISMKRTCTSFWIVFSPSGVLMIGYTPFQTRRIGNQIWTSGCLSAGASISPFLVCIMWRRLICCLNCMTSSTSVGQRGGLYLTAVDYFPSHGLLYLCISRQSSWVIKSAPCVSDIFQVWSIVC